MAKTKEQQEARLKLRDEILAKIEADKAAKAALIAFNKSHEGLLSRLKKSGKTLVYQCPDESVIAYHYVREQLYKRVGKDEHHLGARKKVSAIAEGHKSLIVKGIL